MEQNLKMGMMHGAAGAQTGANNPIGMSIIWMAIIAAVVNLSSQLVQEFLPMVRRWVGDIFSKVTHSSNEVHINYVSWYNAKTGDWTANQDEEHNHFLLDAVLYAIS